MAKIFFLPLVYEQRPVKNIIRPMGWETLIFRCSTGGAWSSIGPVVETTTLLCRSRVLDKDDDDDDDNRRTVIFSEQ